MKTTPNGDRHQSIPNKDLIASIVIFAVVLIIRIPMFQSIQMWDGGFYYSRLVRIAENLEWSIRYIWDNFRLAGHTAIMFCAFLLPGELITPGSSVGVNLITAIMTAAAMVCLYRIFRKMSPETDERLAAIVVLLAQLAPLFWGTSSYVNLDYTYVIFFIYMWYAHINKRNILTFFWMMCVVMTKETGAMLIAGYFGVYVLQIFFGERGIKTGERFKCLWRDPVIRILMFGAVLMIVYFVRQGAMSGWTPASSDYIGGHSWLATSARIEAYGQEVNAFGIYPKYIICNILQMFAIHFSWIASLAIVICLVIQIRTHSVNRELWRCLAPMLGAMAGYAIFNMLYIAWAIPRYVVFSAVMVWFTAGVVVCDTFKNSRKPVYIAAAVCAPLLIIETFFFIDPISNAAFLRLDTGKGTMLSMAMHTEYYADPIVSNYRFNYLAGLVDKMIADAEYDTDMQIVTWNANDDQCYIDDCGVYPLAWNSGKNKRILLTNRLLDRMTEGGAPEVIPLNFIDADTGTPAADRLLVYFLPYNGQDQAKELARFTDAYEPGEARTVSNWGGTLTYYVLDRK